MMNVQISGDPGISMRATSVSTRMELVHAVYVVFGSHLVFLDCMVLAFSGSKLLLFQES